jgi:predicted transcriptional regulator
MADQGGQLRVRLDPQTEWELGELARKLRASRSTVVRMAVAQMAAREGIVWPGRREQSGERAA